MARDLLSFPVCTFERVFDTAPVQDTLSLPELMLVFRRFELKHKLHVKIEREVHRIDAIWERWQSGEELAGKRVSKIRAAERQALEEGADPGEAVGARVAEMKEDVRRDAKKDLRLWSPTLYAPDAVKRGTDQVTHLSCVVLDYDDGTPLEEASAAWSEWFHLVHTTWSHQPTHPKFRLIVPLAQPVAAAHWSAMWEWAEERSGQVIDPACKSPASTYALPAIAQRDSPRAAFAHEGALLDPVVEAIVAPGPPPASPTLSPERWLTAGQPDAEYLLQEPRESAAAAKHPAPAAAAVEATEAMPPSVDDWDEFEWASAAAGPASGRSPGHEPTAPPSDVARLVAVVERLEGLIVRLEARGAPSWAISDEIERLEALRERGALTKREFRAAKARLLDLDS